MKDRDDNVIHVVFGGDGGYRIVYGQRLADPGGDDEQARARELTSAATALVESWIRARPGCWLWLHDRWKSQPHRDELTEIQK